MKTIICGGRYYKFNDEDFKFLDKINNELPITEVVCGCATGADTEGETWAHDNFIPVKKFPANWKYGKCAGSLRNAEMAEYADACIAFPGGNGTKDMIYKATMKGLKVIIVNNKSED